MIEGQLPAGTRLGVVELRVADLRRSLGFYRDLLGLQVVADDTASASLAAAPHGRPLLILVEAPGAAPRPPRTIGLYHLAFRLPERRDLAQLVHRLLRQRWRIQGAYDNAVSEAVYLTDPDGNGVELYVDRPPDLWRWEEGGVVMQALPLDLSGLLLDFRYELDHSRGIPEGAEVGHIHLHVSELAGAEAFYHGLLGFEVTTRSNPGVLYFAAGGYHHHIGVNVWISSRARPPAGSAGLVSFEVVVPDAAALDGIYRNAVGRGWAISPSGSGWRVEDQDGNTVVVRTD